MLVILDVSSWVVSHRDAAYLCFSDDGGVVGHVYVDGHGAKENPAKTRLKWGNIPMFHRISYVPAISDYPMFHRISYFLQLVQGFLSSTAI